MTIGLGRAALVLLIALAIAAPAFAQSESDGASDVDQILSVAQKFSSSIFQVKEGDNFAYGGIAFLAVYYFFVWMLVGKDPMKGHVLPSETPPENMSPAAIRYVQKMGQDNLVFISAIMSMGVKGYLRIEEDESGAFTVLRDSADADVLSPDEKACAESLFQGRDDLVLRNDNYKPLVDARSALLKILIKAHKGIHFRANGWYLFGGFIFSLFSLGMAGAAQDAFGPVLFMSFWLTIWTVGVVALIGSALSKWFGIFTGKSSIFGAIFMSILALIFSAIEIVVIGFLASVASIGTVAAILVMSILHVIFFTLLKAPTRLGRKLMDKIDGFKQGLGSTALGRASSQSLTAQRFEENLPYAIALDVAPDWTKNFSQSLATPAADPPRWYQTPKWPEMGHAGLASALTESFASAVLTASTPPSNDDD
jgi:hypothetical protein